MAPLNQFKQSHYVYTLAVSNIYKYKYTHALYLCKHSTCRQELAGALFKLSAGGLCVLHVKWQWFVRTETLKVHSVVTFNHPDEENWDLWVLRKETKKGNWHPQWEHRSLTHISCLITDWYDHEVEALLAHLLFHLVITVTNSVLLSVSAIRNICHLCHYLG